MKTNRPLVSKSTVKSFVTLLLLTIFRASNCRAVNQVNVQTGDSLTKFACGEFVLSMSTITGSKLKCNRVDLGHEEKFNKLKFNGAFLRNRSTLPLTNSGGHGDRVTSARVRGTTNVNNVQTSSKQDLASDQQYINPAFDHLNNYPMNEFTLNPLNSLFPLYGSPFVQPLKPDFFNYFHSPVKMGPTGEINSNPAIVSLMDILRKSHLTDQNVTGMSLGTPGVQGAQSDPHHFLPRSSEMRLSTFPKIFTFSDERVNLVDFEKAKKSGIKPSILTGPPMDMAPRDSYLMLHGGNYL